MKRLAIAAILGTLVTASAQAGQKSTYPVGISGSSAYGAIGDARSSANPVEHIGCNVFGWSGATSGYAFCWAVDSMGHSLQCSSSNPYIVQAAAAVTSFSYINFQADKGGYCTQLDVQNHSQYAPMVP